MSTTGKKSPKALTRTFAPTLPTKWYVYMTGVSFGASADVKAQVMAALEAAFDAGGTPPGLTELTVTAQTPGASEKKR